MKSPQTAMQHLLSSVQTLFIASLNNDGTPHASYAPYIRDENGDLYIFVSQLAQHTRNLLKSDTTSVLIAEDEQQSKQIFAKTRLQYQCEIHLIERHHTAFSSIIDIMERQFGETVQVLKSLPDFHLFRLKPITGVFVIGFGQAYQLGGERLQTLKRIEPPKSTQ